MRVIIIGGGIGGLCLAQGLVKAGVEVAVYEQDKGRAERVDRYRLHLNPAGSRALHACLPVAAWERFLAGVGETEGGFAFLTERLRTLVIVENSIMYPESADPAEQAHPVDRMFLRDVLLTGLDDVVQFGKKFDHYTLLPDGTVSAHFADGSEAVGDVLIGADGVGSAVRRQYLPGSEPVPTGGLGVGWTVFLNGNRDGSVDDSDGSSDGSDASHGDSRGPRIPQRIRSGMNMIMAPAPFFLFTSVFRRPGRAGESDGDYLLCALVADRKACPPGIESLGGTELRAAVAAMMADWHPDLIRLAAEADPGKFGVFPFAAAPTPDAWPSSAVTVLGDAIHCMPPAGGIGANMALRDANLLTRNLAAAARGEMPLLGAIGDYEREMRDYAFGSVQSALRTERIGRNSSPVAQTGIRTFFRLANAVPAIKRAGFGDSWAKDARPRPWEIDSARGIVSPRSAAGTPESATGTGRP